MKSASLTPYSELEIINGCIIGDREAQRRLYNEFSPKMLLVCLRYAKDYHQAEDLLQDGFIKVFKYIANFRREGSFEGWMRRIFVNTCIESFRRNITLFSIVDEEDKQLDIPDEKVFDSLEVNDLMSLVQSLSHGYRTIFNLYAIEGYSHKEISQMLNISEGTSKSQLARARALLQKRLVALHPSYVARLSGGEVSG